MKIQYPKWAKRFANFFLGCQQEIQTHHQPRNDRVDREAFTIMDLEIRLQLLEAKMEDVRVFLCAIR